MSHYLLLSLIAVVIVSGIEGGKLAHLRNTTVNDVVCPDQGHCYDGETCCQLVSGDYGCCPFENAVCCPDKETCCPSGKTCDGSGGCRSKSFHLTKAQVKDPNVNKISSGTKSVQFLELALRSPSNLICPDPAWQCPGLQSCCKQGSIWVCCPYAYGVCCGGGFSCCPAGQHCDATGTLCYKETGEQQSSLRFLQSILAKQTYEEK